MIFIAKGTVLVASPQNYLRIGRGSPSRSAPQRASPVQGAEAASTRGLSLFQEYVFRREFERYAFEDEVRPLPEGHRPAVDG